MTDKEKVKAYDEALKKASAAYKDEDKHLKETLERIFPELNKNKDEMIKTAILNHLKKMWGNFQDDICGVHVEDTIDWIERQGKEEHALKSFKDEDVRKFMQYIEKLAKAYELNLPNRSYDIFAFAKDVLVWLEKKGEQKKQVHFPKFTFDDVLALQCCMETVKKVQEDKELYEKLNLIHSKIYDAYSSNTEKINKKPTNKIEQKFKVGDWVVRGDTIAQILDIQEQYYIGLDINGKDFVSSRFLNDNKIHLWTLQDAKDGNVLVNGSNIFIFHHIDNKRLMGYCHVNMDDGNLYNDIGRNECFCTIDAPITPATKEQRDILFKKIKEKRDNI